MPELRQDPITGRWVSIAQDRSQRPFDVKGASHQGAAASTSAAALCPFCPGNESETPPESMAERGIDSSPNDPDWQVRVVPNKYPAFIPAANQSADIVERVDHGDDLFPCQQAVGVHEVIIESARHVVSVTQLTDVEMSQVVSVYRERIRQLSADPRLKYCLIFKNSGRDAGASLEHVHSQLVALPDVPAAATERFAGSRRYFERTGRPVWADIVSREQDGPRLVRQTRHLAAICPYASRVPLELLIVPTGLATRFEAIHDDVVADLAQLLRDLIGRLEAVIDDLSFNYLIHTSPFDTSGDDHYQWHVEILPRLTKTAGYEWGTGNAINSVSPEQAAQRLRNSPAVAANSPNSQQPFSSGKG